MPPEGRYIFRCVWIRSEDRVLAHTRMPRISQRTAPLEEINDRNNVYAHQMSPPQKEGRCMQESYIDAEQRRDLYRGIAQPYPEGKALYKIITNKSCAPIMRTKNMNNTKQTIARLMLDTMREGTENMIEYLDQGTDFFEAPASTRHHCAHAGGLAEHSLNVCNALMRLDGLLCPEHPHDQIIITALLHDVCKTNYYTQEKAWRKDDRGKWESYIRWGVKDDLPLGHGEKSLYIISKFIDLSDAEAAAIRWHMGAWTSGVTTDYSLSNAYNAAVNKYPLVTLLATADNLATHLIEKEATI